MRTNMYTDLYCNLCPTERKENTDGPVSFLRDVEKSYYFHAVYGLAQQLLKIIVTSKM